MKKYIGARIDEVGWDVYVLDALGKRYPLPLRLDIRNHSPTGFNCGYQGSGAAQLALAILADFIGASKPPVKCPYCESPMNGWKCTEKECAYDGDKCGDAWMTIMGHGAHYQEFKREFIAKIQGDKFEIPGEEIAAWIETQKQTYQ